MTCTRPSTYRKAVDFTEELRSSLQRNDREKFFDVKVYGVFRTAPYEGLVRVLLRMNKFPEALKESEYSKARVFRGTCFRADSGRPS